MACVLASRVPIAVQRASPADGMCADLQSAKRRALKAGEAAAAGMDGDEALAAEKAELEAAEMERAKVSDWASSMDEQLYHA